MKKLLVLLIAVALFAAGCVPKSTDEDITAKDMTTEVTATEDMTDTSDKATAEPAMSDNFLDVTMKDINGNEWNLAKLDQKAVVKVWASWCSVCLSGMNEYRNFTQTYEDAQVLTVVSPGMLGEMNKRDFVEWFKSLEEQQDIIVILDEEGVLIKNLGIRAFPSYVYINSDGEAVSGAIGHQKTADVIASLEEIQ